MLTQRSADIMAGLGIPPKKGVGKSIFEMLNIKATLTLTLTPPPQPYPNPNPNPIRRPTSATARRAISAPTRCRNVRSALPWSSRASSPRASSRRPHRPLLSNSTCLTRHRRPETAPVRRRRRRTRWRHRRRRRRTRRRRRLAAAAAAQSATATATATATAMEATVAATAAAADSRLTLTLTLTLTL
jgi:hypothetical protein